MRRKLVVAAKFRPSIEDEDTWLGALVSTSQFLAAVETAMAIPELSFVMSAEKALILQGLVDQVKTAIDNDDSEGLDGYSDALVEMFNPWFKCVCEDLERLKTAIDPTIFADQRRRRGLAYAREY